LHTPSSASSIDCTSRLVDAAAISTSGRGKPRTEARPTRRLCPCCRRRSRMLSLSPTSSMRWGSDDRPRTARTTSAGRRSRRAHIAFSRLWLRRSRDRRRISLLGSASAARAACDRRTRARGRRRARARIERVESDGCPVSFNRPRIAAFRSRGPRVLRPNPALDLGVVLHRANRRGILVTLVSTPTCGGTDCRSRA